MSDGQPTRLSFAIVGSAQPGLPCEDNEGYRMLLDAAVSGGPGTTTYLQHMLRFAGLATHLASAGAGAFVAGESPDANSRVASATDGHSRMDVLVRLNDDLAETDFNGIPVRGVATIRLSQPEPYNIVKIVELGLGLGEIPAGIVVTKVLWDALFEPLLSRLTTFIRSAVTEWLETEVGDLDALGESIGDTAAEVAEAESEEVAELVIEEEVVAEIAIDLAAAGPAAAVLGVLIAIPLLIQALSKTFELHLEIDNVTDHDLTWALEHQYDGSMTTQPATAVLPKMGRATDAWGDKTDVDVIFQGNFTSTNKSGFKGMGYALRLAFPDLPGQDVAAVISVPYMADNAVWLGDARDVTDWRALFDQHGTGDGRLVVHHGNQKLYVALAIDALVGQGDVYHAVLRVLPL